MPRFRCCLLALAIALYSTAARSETVTVFAAASLKNALEAIAIDFSAATGHEVAVSLAGSSVLAWQIEQGAPADIFISASIDWMDRLEAAGLIEPASRVDLLGNKLVLIGDLQASPVTIDARLDLPALLGEGRLAMALVDAVPAGIYGRAALQSMGVWDAVAPQVAQADNVRAALALVALGEAPLGIVYETDARAEPSVQVLGTFPATSHPSIIFPAARIAGRPGPAADALMAHLQGADAAEAFAAQGFTVLGQ